MQCAYCENKAVISLPARCKDCFIERFEKRVWDTVERFSLIGAGEKICVAASGGKDSLTTLYLLSQRYTVTALAVDEGIAGYRDKTLEDLRGFCAEHNIALRVVTFADVGSKRLDELKPKHPCSVCGVLRRKALLQYSREYDVIATGHNLDDECQSILMNLLRNQQALLARLGPRTPSREGIAARIKPLYLTPEREVRAYCVLQRIPATFVECPNIGENFRWKVSEAVDALEAEQPGSKLNIVEHFLSQTFDQEETYFVCTSCGGPASQELCKACRLVKN